MKRFILFVAFSFLIIPAFSQISIGITGGYTLAGQHIERISPAIHNSPVSVWHAGVIAEKNITGNIYLQPQLLISRKGTDYGSEIGKNSNKFVFHLTYLELPLNVIYKFKSGKGKWYAGAGPYFARGLGGRNDIHVKLEVEGGDIVEYTFKKDVVFKSNLIGKQDDKETYIRSTDIGLNLIGGYELKNGLFFNANYSLGFLGVWKGDSKQRNRYMGVSVGYFLKRFK